MADNNDCIRFTKEFKGHNGWVTCLKVPQSSQTLVSGSRDKKLMIWNCDKSSDNYGRPIKSLTGHSHFISDLDISYDGEHVITSSWDRTLRLWNIKDFYCK